MRGRQRQKIYGRGGDRTDLERLGIPVSHLLDGWHLSEVVWKVIEFSDAVCQSDWKFLYSDAERIASVYCLVTLTTEMICN